MNLVWGNKRTTSHKTRVTGANKSTLEIPMQRKGFSKPRGGKRSGGPLGCWAARITLEGSQIHPANQTSKNKATSAITQTIPKLMNTEDGCQLKVRLYDLVCLLFDLLHLSSTIDSLLRQQPIISPSSPIRACLQIGLISRMSGSLWLLFEPPQQRDPKSRTHTLY